jgi:hypothetical protein
LFCTKKPENKCDRPLAGLAILLILQRDGLDGGANGVFQRMEEWMVRL